MFANDDARRPSDQFTSKELHLRAYANGITLDFSRSGKPTDNAYVETFNATVRLLGRHWFLDPGGDREKVEEWHTEYNEVRPTRRRCP